MASLFNSWSESHVLFLQTFLRREGSYEAHYSGTRETEKVLRFVLVELEFLASSFAVGRCPGTNSVDCAKLAVKRRSQETQLDQDRGFRMRIDASGLVHYLVKCCCLCIYIQVCAKKYISSVNYDNKLSTEGCVDKFDKDKQDNLVV